VQLDDTQAPFTQSSPAWHIAPVLPQPELTHWPLTHDWPLAQPMPPLHTATQRPFTHASPLVHAVFALHWPIWQTPFTHVVPAGHITPFAPQLLFWLWHMPLMHASPAAQPMPLLQGLCWVQTPFTQSVPFGQIWLPMHALLGWHVPVEVQTSPIGHGALGPQTLMVAVQMPLRHAWPAGQFTSLMHRPHAPLLHALHWPLMQTSPG
jgi:hypothetical protein